MSIVYMPVVPSNPQSSGNHHKPTKDGTYALLVSALDQLGLTRLKLGRILGLSDPGNTLGWFNMRWAPSQVYIQRIMYLLLLKLEGVDFRKVQGIDWEKTGEVIWKKGVMDESEGDQNLVGIGRGLPSSRRADFIGLADLPDLQER